MIYNKYTLKELATIRYGKNQKNVVSLDGSFPIYGTGGLMGYASKYLYDKPSVLIGRKGTIDKVRYVTHPFWTVDTLFYTEINDAIVLPHFLYYVLSLLDLRKYNEGTSIPSLRTETLNRLELYIPPLSEQKKILSFIEPIEEKIDINSRINRNLSEQAAALYKSWFVDFEPFEGEKPDDWNDGTVGDLANEIVCGKTPSTKKEEYYGKDVPFVTIPDMHGCIYTVHTERKLSVLGADSQSKKTLPKNSICVSCIGTAGLVVLLPEPSQTNQQINTIVPKANYSPYYIYLMMDTMAETINKLGQAGSTIVNLNKTQFGKMEVMIPSVAAMSDFDEIVEPMFKEILSNQIENKELLLLRDELLPKLMVGDIDLSDIELLKR